MWSKSLADGDAGRALCPLIFYYRSITNAALSDSHIDQADQLKGVLKKEEGTTGGKTTDHH